MEAVAASHLQIHEESDVAPRAARATDFTKTNIPLMMAITAIISAVMSTVAASAFFWTMEMGKRVDQAEMKGDIRVILQRLDSDGRVQEANRRVDQVNVESMNESIKTLQGNVKMLELQYGQLSKELAQGRK